MVRAMDSYPHRITREWPISGRVYPMLPYTAPEYLEKWGTRKQLKLTDLNLRPSPVLFPQLHNQKHKQTKKVKITSFFKPK